MALNPRKLGVQVKCETCGKMKQPRGRSAPLGCDYCDHECDGYMLPPYVGSLWPNESESDFGYDVGEDGTAIK